MWFAVKCKFSPGPLHSHAACKLPSSMLLFGGERNGQLINELWRFHFGTETWQRIRTDVISPQPVSECCAITVSDLLLRNGAVNVRNGGCGDGDSDGDGDGDNDNGRLRFDRAATATKATVAAVAAKSRTTERSLRAACCNNELANNGGASGTSNANYYSCYISRLAGNESCSAGGVQGVMMPPRRQATTPNSCNLSFLKEISKLSQMNLSRLTQNVRCSYHALGSNESLQNVDETVDGESSRVAGGAKRDAGRWSAYSTGSVLRDVSSLVNTPLTPSEAAKLVYLDGEEAPALPTFTDEFSAVHQRLHPSQNRNRRSYPLTNTVRFANPLVTPEQPSPDITSDYASCENIHKLLSSNNRLNTTCCYGNAVVTSNGGGGGGGGGGDRVKTPSKDSPMISFSNPNYFTNTCSQSQSQSPSLSSPPSSSQQPLSPPQIGYVEEKIVRGDYVKLNSPADSLLEDSASHGDGYEMTELRPKPPKSLPLTNSESDTMLTAADIPQRRKRYRACSAGRYERESVTSLCVFLIGGKDRCQMTTFKRPISIWRLSLTEDMY